VQVNLATLTAQTNTDVTQTSANNEAVGDILSNVETLTGSRYNDTLTGDANANTINGLAGNDLISGGAGADILNGGDGRDTFKYVVGDGADTIDGGSGADIADYSAAAVFVDANLSLNTITVAAEVDTLISVERFVGSAQADIIVAVGAGTGINTYFNIIGSNGVMGSVEGGAGADTIYSASVGDSSILFGGAGNDVYDGVLNSDTKDWFGLNGVTGVTAGGIDSIKGFDDVDGDKLLVKLSDFGMTLANATGTANTQVLNTGTGAGVFYSEYNAAGKLSGIQMAGDGIVNSATTVASTVANVSALANAAHAQFIYNQFDNSLWYDATGTATAGDAVKIAQFDAANTDGAPTVTTNGVANTFDSQDFVFANL
jgi:Ca2+-binding RTX toxin-like protein